MYTVSGTYLRLYNKPQLTLYPSQWSNSYFPEQNDCHLPNEIFKCIYVNENIWISIQISLKFVSYG